MGPNLPTRFTAGIFDNCMMDLSSEFNVGCYCLNDGEVECAMLPGQGGFLASSSLCMTAEIITNAWMWGPPTRPLSTECRASPYNFAGCSSGCEFFADPTSAGSCFFGGSCPRSFKKCSTLPCSCNCAYVSQVY
jgi:hypothetical protein